MAKWNPFDAKRPDDSILNRPLGARTPDPTLGAQQAEHSGALTPETHAREAALEDAQKKYEEAVNKYWTPGQPYPLSTDPRVLADPEAQKWQAEITKQQAILNNGQEPTGTMMDPNTGQMIPSGVVPRPQSDTVLTPAQVTYNATQTGNAQAQQRTQDAINRLNTVASGIGQPAPQSQAQQMQGATRGAPFAANTQLAAALPATRSISTPRPADPILSQRADTLNRLNAAANAIPQTGTGTPNYAAQGAASANRAAPQIVENGQGQAAQQQALSAAQSFQPNTSGVAGIRSAVADTSGARALQNFQGDTQGINNLDQFQASNTQQGVSDLRNFTSANSINGVAALSTFNADDAAQGARSLDQYRPTEGAQAVRDLNGFDNSQTRLAARDLNTFNPTATREAATGLQDFRATDASYVPLQQFATEAQGPSAAQALLRAQSDKDTRTAIALARSARGGPAAVAQAQRQAQSEGAAIQAETRGQGAALAAQEFDTYKQRQLAALQASGQIISNQEAMRLSAQQAAGQLISQADQTKLAAFNAAAQATIAGDNQKLAATQTAAQVRSQMDAQRLGATTAAADVRTQMSAQKLAGLQSSGQILSQMDQQRLGALTASGQLQSNMDQQKLGALQSAGQLRLGNDTNQVNAQSNAANILLQGSQINQQGQIAATNAELAGSAQKLQALSLQGQISSDIRNADIDVLKSNLSASLQQLNLNDTQVRAFAQMGEDARQANQNASLQASQLGLNAAQVQSQLDLQWQQFAYGQLSDAQQVALQQQALSQGLVINGQQRQTAQDNSNKQLLGTAILAIGSAASDERVKTKIKDAPDIGKALRDSPGREYEYKDPKHGEGKYVGPMAQDLQKSPVFRGAVKKSKEGHLEVDTTRLALSHHAALSHLQKEIDALKKLRNKRKELAA
jgi:hypothetical protein